MADEYAESTKRREAMDNRVEELRGHMKLFTGERPADWLLAN